MSEKNQSDYWKKYNSSQSKPQKSKSYPKISKPQINKSFIILLSLFIGILILGYANFKTGKYVGVLEQNNTNLEAELGDCQNQTSILDYDLNICADDLNTCNNDLSSKTQSLTSCQNQKNNLDSSLSDCQDDLNSWRRDYQDLEDDYNNLIDDYNKCDDDLDSCESDLDNFNALKENYAKYKCCPQGVIYYRISGNNVDCTNSTSDTYISC